jgi:hypothetical protein
LASVATDLGFLGRRSNRGARGHVDPYTTEDSGTGVKGKTIVEGGERDTLSPRWRGHGLGPEVLER